MLRFLLIISSLIPFTSCFSQISKEKLEEEFKKYDITENGYLSGTEITSCNCKEYDKDGDNVIYLSEFLAGRGIAANNSSTKKSNTSGTNNKNASTQQNANNTTTENYTVGEKVYVWNTGWYPALVTEVKNGSYKIDYYEWTGYADEWLKDDRIRKWESTREYTPGGTTSNGKPEMNGSIPNLIGTSWAVKTIYKKGTTPTSDRMDNYLFCKSGHWEYNVNAIANRGTYKVKGNQLIITGQGNQICTYKITWNERENYVELDDGEWIIRLIYNTKASC